MTYASISVGIDAVPLQNDYCAGALPLTDYTYYSVNTASAQNDAVPSLGTIHAGVWFTWTAAVDGAATVDTGGSSFDTMVEVFRGPCNALVSLGGNDDNTTWGTQAMMSCAAPPAPPIGSVPGGYSGSGNLSLRVYGVAGNPPRFTKTGAATLNGILTDTINWLPVLRSQGAFRPSPGIIS